MNKPKLKYAVACDTRNDVYVFLESTKRVHILSATDTNSCDLQGP